MKQYCRYCAEAFGTDNDDFVVRCKGLHEKQEQLRPKTSVINSNLTNDLTLDKPRIDKKARMTLKPNAIILKRGGFNNEHDINQQEISKYVDWCLKNKLCIGCSEKVPPKKGVRTMKLSAGIFFKTKI